MKSDNSIRIIQTVLAAVVAGFVISVVVAGHWWTAPPPTVNVAAVAKDVERLLNTQMATSDAFSKYEITVDNGGLTLINTDLNKYDGLATVHTRKGTSKFLSVTVWADPAGDMFYQMDVASAAKLLEAAAEEEFPSP